MVFSLCDVEKYSHLVFIGVDKLRLMCDTFGGFVSFIVA
jgi:hypothetical protein